MEGHKALNLGYKNKKNMEGHKSFWPTGHSENDVMSGGDRQT